MRDRLQICVKLLQNKCFVISCCTCNKTIRFLLQFCIVKQMYNLFDIAKCVKFDDASCIAKKIISKL